MLRVYQYLAPAIMAPLSWFLCWQTYQRIDLVMMAWLIPIVWAYVVPAVGTNVLKVWNLMSLGNSVTSGRIMDSCSAVPPPR